MWSIKLSSFEGNPNNALPSQGLKLSVVAAQRQFDGAFFAMSFDAFAKKKITSHAIFICVKNSCIHAAFLRIKCDQCLNKRRTDALERSILGKFTLDK